MDSLLRPGSPVVTGVSKCPLGTDEVRDTGVGLGIEGKRAVGAVRALDRLFRFKRSPGGGESHKEKQDTAEKREVFKQLHRYLRLLADKNKASRLPTGSKLALT